MVRCENNKRTRALLSRIRSQMRSDDWLVVSGILGAANTCTSSVSLVACRHLRRSLRTHVCSSLQSCKSTRTDVCKVGGQIGPNETAQLHPPKVFRAGRLVAVRRACNASSVVNMPRAPRNKSKVYKVPRRPYEAPRLDAELKLAGEYGLRK